MLEHINSFLFDKCCLILLAFTGGFMMLRTRFFPLRHAPLIYKKTIKSLFEKDADGNTSFGAVCTALGATLGVGNIAGVSAAIVLGGPGAVFWMWVSACLGCATAYSENVLGVFYRRRSATGFRGGAMYYLSDGLGRKKGCRLLGKTLARLFAFFCILASFGIGNISQINTITVNMKTSLDLAFLSDINLLGTDLYSLLLGLALAAAAGFCLLGGEKRLFKMTEKIVPFMVIGYLLGCGVIIARNINLLASAIGAIFRFAFSPPAALGGVSGATLGKVIGIGFRRGMFSSEAGLGSSVIVNSAASEREPAVMGMWGIFEVFVDTVVVCTVTALCVLCSGFVDLTSGAAVDCEASALVNLCFDRFFGRAGGVFIALSILFFAFASVLGWSYYGAAAWEYLFGGKTAVYKAIFTAFVLLGTNIDASLSWALSDTANALMMLPNLIGVLSSNRVVVSVTQNYLARTLKHKKIKPLVNQF